jgi:hypothetical protein
MYKIGLNHNLRHTEEADNHSHPKHHSSPRPRSTSVYCVIFFLNVIETLWEVIEKTFSHILNLPPEVQYEQ